MLCHILLLNYGGEFQLISVLKKNSNILSLKKKLRCFLTQQNHFKPFPNQTALDYLVLYLCPSHSRGSQEISTRETENRNSSLVCISQNHSFISPKETPILLQKCSKYYKNFPGKNTVMGCHFLLQGIFLTQGLNPGLLHCRQILYHLSQQGRYHIVDQHVLGSFYQLCTINRLLVFQQVQNNPKCGCLEAY